MVDILFNYKVYMYHLNSVYIHITITTFIQLENNSLNNCYITTNLRKATNSF